jgi:hypothetical protein
MSEEIVKKYAELQCEVAILKRQFSILVDAVADAKTAIMIATNAQTMAAEALIKSSTGNTLDELGQGNPSFDDDPLGNVSPRNKFYETLKGGKG